MKIGALIKTPSKWRVVALFAGCYWLALPLITRWHYTALLQGGRLDSNHDSIGIPSDDLDRAWLILTPLVILFWVFILWRYRGGVSLFCWNPSRPIRSWCATIILGLFMVKSFGAMILSVFDMIPTDLLAGGVEFYLFALARATLAAAGQPREFRTNQTTV